MSEEEIRKKLLNRYAEVLKKYRVAVAGRSCTSTRDFLHGRVSEIREVVVLLYGSEAPNMLRSVEGD